VTAATRATRRCCSGIRGCFAFLLLCGATWAGGREGATTALGRAITGGSAALELRYRYEWVDQADFDTHARASLLRTRLRLESAPANSLGALLEVDDVSAVGVDDYDSTGNGRTGFPTIADPEGTEFNQAYLAYRRDIGEVRIGRQRILLGDMRFVGSKPWRQNEQTYDGLRFRWKSTSGLSLDASYVNQINRIFGPEDGRNPADLFGDNLFLRGSHPIAEHHELIAFAYLLDVEAQADFTPGQTVNNSSDSFGIEYRGAFSTLNLRAAVATQKDAGDSELDYRAAYYVAEVEAPLGGLTLRGAYEVLGAGDGVGFATPLNNGHRYQGWADMFLSTPDDGIEDAWLSVEGSLGPIALTARYHDFRAEASSVVFGTELDLQAEWTINPWLTATLKGAIFDSQAADRYPDTTRAWLMLQLNL